MKVWHGPDQFIAPTYSVVTGGTFDGVHEGHKKIFRRLREITDKVAAAESIVLTFWPHPRLVLFPEQTDLKLLSSLEEKIEQLEALGVDHLVILPFDKAFSELSSEEFIQQILINRLKTKRLVIGYDHRFGHNREGSFEHLKAKQDDYRFTVEEIPRHEVEEVTVSSTKIRTALFAGEVKTAADLLGRPYSLDGKVVKGRQVGRTIGFPTANLEPTEPFKLIPEDGIYAVRLRIGDEMKKGMLYIGTRATLGDNLSRTIEVNIFEFDREIYGENIRLYFVKQLRADRKFESLDEMKIQLLADKMATLEALRKEDK